MPKRQWHSTRRIHGENMMHAHVRARVCVCERERGCGVCVCERERGCGGCVTRARLTAVNTAQRIPWGTRGDVLTAVNTAQRIPWGTCSDVLTAVNTAQRIPWGTRSDVLPVVVCGGDPEVHHGAGYVVGGVASCIVALAGAECVLVRVLASFHPVHISTRAHTASANRMGQAQGRGRWKVEGRRIQPKD